MNKEVSDPFWYNKNEILWDSNRLTEFFPTKDQTIEERFNSIVRLSFYISIILYFYHSDIKYLFIFVAVLLITYYLYTNYPKETDIKSNNDNKIPRETIGLIEKLENNDKSNTVCTEPSIDNPFMNATMKDYLNIDPNTQSIVDRPPACSTSNPEIKKKLDNYFNNNLYKDVNDVFGKMNSQRQFFTMPWTTIPNAQNEFAKWLYLNPKTCKEDQDYCLKYEDIRAKKPIVYNETQNPVNTKRLQN